jgi:tocopherol cyclase
MLTKKIRNPEIFQGTRKKNRYFEGWYYKIVNQDESMSLAFIPGISLNKKDPHAFVQVFIVTKEELDIHLKTYYVRYKKEDFIYSHEPFFVQIGQNTFSKSEVHIDLVADGTPFQGHFNLTHLTPIQQSLFVPNIMGPFAYLGFMECYHGVISMSHHVSGYFLNVEKRISFNEGKGYLEKDWGKSFPREYVWMQSNHFKDKDVSLMFSYAHIPFLGLYFKGLIANIHIKGKEYRFATYNRAKVIQEIIETRKATYLVKRGPYLLKIVAETKKEIELASPKDGVMNQTIKEGLAGEIHIELHHREKLIYKGLGTSAGIEIMKPLTLKKKSN